jgi:hypothetical protein
MIGLTPDIVHDRMWGTCLRGCPHRGGLAQVVVDDEAGTVVRPGGADLAPDTLYVRVSSGAWPKSPAAA